MEEFITMAAGKLGIDAGTAQKATGALLGLIRKEGEPSAVGQLFDKLPGAAAMAKAPAAGAGGGLLGKVGGMLGGLTGGKAGGIGAIASSGLSADKVPGFVRTFIDWVKKKVGPDIVNKVVASIPALKGLV